MATLTLTDVREVPAPEERVDLKSRLLAYERTLIITALADARGNQRRAARQLGILPTTLHEKLKRLRLRADAFLPARSTRAEAGPRAVERIEAAAADGEASL